MRSTTCHSTLESGLVGLLLVGSCFAHPVAETMKTERGYVISETQAQVLGQLPAPTLNAAGECIPSNLSFENAADKTSGWQPTRRNGTPNYDQFLLLWGIYHFGERAGSDNDPIAIPGICLEKRIV